jgi:hypothetical protein
VLFTLQACGDSTGNGGGGDLSDPAVFEATMKQNFLPIVAGVTDALERLLTAVGAVGLVACLLASLHLVPLGWRLLSPAARSVA